MKQVWIYPDLSRFIWIYWEFFSEHSHFSLAMGIFFLTMGITYSSLHYFWLFPPIFRYLYSIFRHIHPISRISILFLDIVIPFLAIYSISAICRIFIIFFRFFSEFFRLPNIYTSTWPWESNYIIIFSDHIDRSHDYPSLATLFST